MTEMKDRCAKSFSIPKPPASIRYQGHRLVEIGCVELLNRIPTGETFHRYLNPQRDDAGRGLRHPWAVGRVPQGHKPLFAEVADELIAFIGDAPLVIHNAGFDLGFINAELERAGRPRSRAIVWSTRCCWRDASIRPAPIGSTISARATASTIRGAASTARCSMPRSWPRSIWN